MAQNSSQSFTAAAKDELCRIPIKKTCCAIAESYGILLFCHTFSNREIRIVSTHAGFIKRCTLLFEKAFGVTPQPVPQNRIRHTLLITDKGDLAKVLTGCGYEPGGFLRLHLNPWIMEEECCLRSFYRGIFLSGGSIVSPQTKSHLELTTSHVRLLQEIPPLLAEKDLNAGASVRETAGAIYLKTGTQVEDFLTLCGAPNSAMEMMQQKAYRSIRNKINRQNNFQDANLDKSIDAGLVQRRAISRLREAGILDTLPPALQDLARIREENPSASTSELASLAGLGRSAVYGRLQKLMKLADTLGEESKTTGSSEP